MRTFIAIEIPTEIKERISKVTALFSLGGVAPAKSDAYHITLQFLGERNETEIQTIKDALSLVKSAKFEIDMHGISYFDPQYLRIIFAKITTGREELKGIYDQIEKNLTQKQIVYKKEHDYVPHLTIARVRSPKSKRRCSHWSRNTPNLSSGSSQSPQSS